MGRVYQSVREVVQGTLHRRTPEITSVQATGDEDSLSDAIEGLENLFVDGIRRLNAAVSDHRAVALTKTKHAEQVTEGLKANIIVLEATLKAKFSQGEQNRVDSTEPSINELDQDRNEPAIDLDGDSQRQSNGMTASMAQAFANLQAQAIARVTEAGRETVSPDAFVSIVAEFSKFANVIENIASLIIRDHVRTLGESMEEFPQKRLPELIESLSNEISHKKLKADFLARFTV